MGQIDQAPGSYADIPDVSYHRWRGASSSRLSDVLKSPAHAQFGMTCHRSTAALKLGSALHCKVLTPAAFDTRFEVRQDRKTSPDDEVTLGANDYAAVMSMSEALAAHPVASKLLGDSQAREHSIVWDDNQSGVRCKARLDQVCKSLPAVIDLKTTRDASYKAFQKAILNYGYHRQGSLYLDAARSAGFEVEHFILIAIESKANVVRNKKPTHAIGVFVLDADFIRLGAAEVLDALAIWKKCEETGEWPGYPERIQDLTPPAWAMKGAEMEETEDDDE